MALTFPLKRINPFNSLINNLKKLSEAEFDEDAIQAFPSRKEKLKLIAAGYWRMFVGNLDCDNRQITQTSDGDYSYGARWDERHGGIADAALLGLGYNLDALATKVMIRAVHEDKRGKAFAALILLKGPINLIRVAIGAPLAVVGLLPTLAIVAVGKVIGAVANGVKNYKSKDSGLVYQKYSGDGDYFTEEPAVRPKQNPGVDMLAQPVNGKNKLDYKKVKAVPGHYWEITKTGKGDKAAFKGTLKKLANAKWEQYSKVVMTREAQDNHALDDTNISADVSIAHSNQKTRNKAGMIFHTFRAKNKTSEDRTREYKQVESGETLVQTFAYIPK